MASHWNESTLSTELTQVALSRMVSKTLEADGSLDHIYLYPTQRKDMVWKLRWQGQSEGQKNWVSCWGRQTCPHCFKEGTVPERTADCQRPSVHPIAKPRPFRRLKRQFLAYLIKSAQITPQITPQPGFPTMAGALWVTYVVAESDIHPRNSHSQLLFSNWWHGFEMSWKLWVYEPIQQKWLTCRSWGLGRLYLISIAVSVS